MRILHLIKNSLPFISGSTIRSKNIFKYQKKFAKVFVLTSVLFTKSKNDLDIIEAIPYFRINSRIGIILRRYYLLVRYINNFLYKYFSISISENIQMLFLLLISKIYINKIVKFYKIDIMHIHTHYPEAKSALKIATRNNIPFIYENRGFGEKNIIVKARTQNRRNAKLLEFKANLIKRRETDLMKKSDLIITLSDLMRKEISKRNIDENKIKIIKNCTDIDFHQPVEIDEKLKNRLNLNRCKIIGYVGRINQYEGIEILLKSVPFLLKNFNNIRILLIGDGPKQYINQLKELINKLNISKYVKFTGSVPHKKVKNYYSIIDIIALPRLNLSVTRNVTPLKPIEAMAYKKLVIASDLPAIRNSIIPSKTGDLFLSENPEDLASKIIFYLKNPEKKKKIEEFSRKYVEEKFSWKTNVPKYKNEYLRLLENVKFKRK